MLLNRLIIVFCFISVFGFSQNQGSNWFFVSSGGVSFDTCADTVVANTSSGMLSDQVGPSKGVSTISDKYGNLLFYSDSRTVYDANYQPLPNANIAAGTGLKGHRNSVILPQPGSDNLFYIFTIDLVGPNNIDDDGINSGFNYSIIDLNLRGGLGDVISNQKNTELITFLEGDPIEAEIKVSDLLTVVRGADCNSYWIITHFQSNFYAFLLDDSGLNTTPIVSTVAPLIDIVSFDNGANFYTGAESLKASPDGNKLAVGHRSYYLLPSGSLGLESEVYVYDFDKSTGSITASQKLNLGTTGDYLVFGLEFSASSQFLYANTREILNIETSATEFSNNLRLFRWNLDTGTSNSQLVYQSNDLQFQHMQLAPDDKIYFTNIPSANGGEYRRYLGEISNPDNLSNDIEVIYQSVLVDPGGNFDNNVSGRLPQVNRQWFNTQIFLVDNSISKCELTLCGGEERFLTAVEIAGATYTWFKDGVELTTEDNYRLLVDDVGFYEVIVEPNDGRCPMEGFATVLLSNDFPNVSNASLFQCDEDGVSDGITQFNLDSISDTVSNNEEDRAVVFYENLTDAQDDINAITNTSNYENTSNPQTIIAQVINLNSGCRAFAEVELQVSNTDSNDTVLSGCDNDGVLDGIGEFILLNANADVIQGLPNNLEITYHINYDDALSKQNILPDNYTNTTPFQQIIYARVEDGLDCYGISEVMLQVFSSPDIETEFEILYCLNSFPETITLTSGIPENTTEVYEFYWSTGENTQNIEVNEIGIYTVTVTDSNGCSTIRTITVLPSDTAIIEDIQIVELTDNNSATVIVSGQSTYEFAINNINGPYQDSNTFENLAPAFYTVFVRDKNGCGITEEVISVVGFPKFFTPNNDGQNDFWQIKGISPSSLPLSPVYIYDRYGKLLKEIAPLSSGWNGTYNGNPLPSSDYWFTVTLKDGRRFSNHFTLKR